MYINILAVDNATALTGYAAIASAILAPVSQVIIAYLTKKDEPESGTVKTVKPTPVDDVTDTTETPVDPELSEFHVQSSTAGTNKLRRRIAFLPSFFYLLSLIGVVLYVNSLRNILPTIQVNECPVGAIIIWSSNTKIPANWRLCDGSELAAAEYKELFTAVGTTWGGSDIAFRLPNFSGRFLQGADTTDAMANRKVVKVGTYQNATLPPHIHEKGSLRVAGGRSSGTGEFMFRTGPSEAVPGVNFHAYPNNAPAISGTRPADCIEIIGDTGIAKTIPQEVLDEQLKPTNAAVSYIIKVH